MARLKTDRQVLRAIYDRYESEYTKQASGQEKPYIPVNVRALAEDLQCHAGILFGRLHFDYGTRFRVRKPDEPHVTLASVFEVAVGDQRHCVNFPYVAALLAGMDHEHRRNSIAIWVSAVALVVSVVGVLVQYMAG